MKQYYQKALQYLKQFTRPYPVRDWYIVLVLNGVLFVATLGIALYFFIGLQSGAIIVPKDGNDVPAPSVSRDDLNQVLEKYKERELNFESENIDTPDVNDPAR